MAKKLKIDPDKFALSVVAGSNFSLMDDEEASNEALKRYLAAYALAQQFNGFVKEQSAWTNDPNFEHIIKVMDKINLV